MALERRSLDAFDDVVDEASLVLCGHPRRDADSDHPVDDAGRDSLLRLSDRMTSTG